MNQIKGPAIFLAQFVGDKPPFNTLKELCKWAASLGYKGIQIPTWEKFLIDLDKAAESKTYCDELKGTIEECGLQITELSTHLQGQLVAVNPAYNAQFDNFCPNHLKGNAKARTEWAIKQVKKAVAASHNLGIAVHATFSGALMWHTMYPWPQRPAGLVKQGFKALANRWLPILDFAKNKGVDICYEIHPGEDLHDGITFERFLEATGNHKAVNILYDPSHLELQQMDYLAYIDHYHSFIKAFHVKDAEFNPTGKSGVYGGYQNWEDRPGRFRSLGDGHIDFSAIFSKLTQYGYSGWAVMEWECCLKSPEQGAAEGAPFIQQHIIEVSDKKFDDFAGSDTDVQLNNTILGI